MEPSTEKDCLQKIEELIFDEDKIVNIKWLSDTLKIPINAAKTYLEKYVGDKRKADPETCSVWYILEGILKNNELQIELVTEKEIDVRKNDYMKICSQFIYIVCKNKNIIPHGIHVSYDSKLLESAPKSGAIVGVNCVKRKIIDTPKNTNEIKKELNSSAVIATKAIKSESKLSSSNQSSSNNKAKSAKQNNGGITNFFANATQKTCSQKNMENKQEIEQPKDCINTQSSEHLQKDNSINEEIKETNMSDKEMASKQAKNKNISKTKGKKRDLSTEKNAKNDSKRRKRIVIESDSEDDIFASEEVEDKESKRMSISEDEIVEVNTVIPKNKKRKCVEKTFTDSDGYIITKKEWIDETDEESEKLQEKINQCNIEDKKQKDTNKNTSVLIEKKQKNVHKTQKSNAKGKTSAAGNQTTLTNFFQRK